MIRNKLKVEKQLFIFLVISSIFTAIVLIIGVLESFKQRLNVDKWFDFYYSCLICGIIVLFVTIAYFRCSKIHHLPKYKDVLIIIIFHISFIIIYLLSFLWAYIQIAIGMIPISVDVKPLDNG